MGGWSRRFPAYPRVRCTPMGSLSTRGKSDGAKATNALPGYDQISAPSSTRLRVGPRRASRSAGPAAPYTTRTCACTQLVHAVQTPRPRPQPKRSPAPHPRPCCPAGPNGTGRAGTRRRRVYLPPPSRWPPRCAGTRPRRSGMPHRRRRCRSRPRPPLRGMHPPRSSMRLPWQRTPAPRAHVRRGRTRSGSHGIVVVAGCGRGLQVLARRTLLRAWGARIARVESRACAGVVSGTGGPGECALGAPHAAVRRSLEPEPSSARGTLVVLYAGLGGCRQRSVRAHAAPVAADTVVPVRHDVVPTRHGTKRSNTIIREQRSVSISIRCPMWTLNTCGER